MPACVPPACLATERGRVACGGTLSPVKFNARAGSVADKSMICTDFKERRRYDLPGERLLRVWTGKKSAKRLHRFTASPRLAIICVRPTRCAAALT